MSASEYWDEVRSLRADLSAAGEEGWSIALKDAFSGAPRAGMSAAVVGCLNRLRSSHACLRLGLTDRIDGLLHAGSDAARARR